MTICPECGAPEGLEINCKTAFDECLVREFEDPSFGEVHHLTVAAYMLQHSSKLSREGWGHMRQLLKEFLVENQTPIQVRIRSREVLDSGNRKWKFTSGDGQPKIDRTTWTKTILDVRLNDSETYCADVIAWAGAALKDSQEMSW
ncbi:MAG TPA: DUF5946 family protein [Anaerolineales bacterium]|jgi:hypothetical protein